MTILRIATTSLATLEDFAPPYNLAHPDPDETLARGLELIDAAGAMKADLVCLPETFKAAGLPASRIEELAEPPDGPSVRALAERAKRHRIHVVAGLFARIDGAISNIDGAISNVAILLDREGRLVGTYAKKHPTEGEIVGGVRPGAASAVFETDIGRIGLAICFDLNWRELWAEMEADGADIVCWLSAYEGGFPLQAYAWLHGVIVVSAVQSYSGKIIDRTGRILTSTSRWGRLTSWEFDTGKRWLHTDGQGEAILAVQKAYGDRVRVETFGEEHMFSIESRDPALAVDTIVRDMGLVTIEDYIARCDAAQRKGRGV